MERLFNSNALEVNSFCFSRWGAKKKTKNQSAGFIYKVCLTSALSNCLVLSAYLGGHIFFSMTQKSNQIKSCIKTRGAD